MSDVFDEVFRLLTPERLLHDPRSRGEGVSVCVVDSGIDQEVIRAAHPEALPIEGGVFLAGQPTPQPYDGRASTPHGTTVADVILRLAPRVRLVSADVFGPRGSCDLDAVLAALRWNLDVWKCKLVNLSLGVAEPHLPQLPRRFQFQRLVEECYFRDVVIVAAAHNDHPFTRSYPALFAPPLLSVDKALFDDPLAVGFGPRDQVEFQAHARAYWGPFSQEPATSWAAPHLTGIAARLLSLRPSLKPFELKTLLHWLAQANHRRSDDCLP
jgi:hypothetical protein